MRQSCKSPPAFLHIYNQLKDRNNREIVGRNAGEIVKAKLLHVHDAIAYAVKFTYVKVPLPLMRGLRKSSSVVTVFRSNEMHVSSLVFVGFYVVVDCIWSN